MDALKSILACFTSSEATDSHANEKHHTPAPQHQYHSGPNYSTFNEKKKQQQHQAQPTKPSTPQDAAAEILSLLLTAPHPSPSLQAKTQALTAHPSNATIISSSSWSQAVARAVLHGMESALKANKAHNGALGAALEKAKAAVTELGEFVKAHPVFFTLLALGVLVMLAPAVVHALGFGALGPVEGSFAAAWQSTYGGVVEAGSLFSYLQKLGMLY